MKSRVYCQSRQIAQVLVGCLVCGWSLRVAVRPVTRQLSVWECLKVKCGVQTLSVFVFPSRQQEAGNSASAAKGEIKQLAINKSVHKRTSLSAKRAKFYRFYTN